MKISEGENMKYLDVEKCLSMIDESKIDRYDYANVYVGASKDDMSICFAYSDKIEDEFTIVRISSKDIELTEEVWREFLAVSALIEKRFNVERIVDDANNYSIDDPADEEPYALKDIPVKYRIDIVQERRLQRVTDILNELGFEYTLQDTLQAMIDAFLPLDIDEKLTAYESLLL